MTITADVLPLGWALIIFAIIFWSYVSLRNKYEEEKMVQTLLSLGEFRIIRSSERAKEINMDASPIMVYSLIAHDESEFNLYLALNQKVCQHFDAKDIVKTINRYMLKTNGQGTTIVKRIYPYIY